MPTSADPSPSPRASRRSVLWGSLVIAAATVAFIAAIWPYHHPAFGFSRFLQLQKEFAAVALPEAQVAPLFVYHANTGYDGQFYAQLALRPALRDPQLQTAIDNPPLRARRMLGSWLAALIGAGDPTRTLHAYAAINVVAWFLLGAVLLRLFPPRSAHNLVAWLGLMASCGVLTSVRYALTDLPSLLLVALALWRLERGPPDWLAAALLATASFARETALFAGTALLPGSDHRRRIGRAVLLVLPLALWMGYVYLTLGRDEGSLRNFALPLSAWITKAAEIIRALPSPDASIYTWFGAACFLSLTVQVVYLVVRPQLRQPAWQIGIGYVALFAILGWPTFEGFPSAFTRILLPLHLAFNRLVPATRRGLALLLLGNLSVFAGFAMLSDGDKFDHEYAHAAIDGTAYVVDEGSGWYGIERDKNHFWSWSTGTGSIQVRRFTDSDTASAAGILSLTLTGFIPAEVTLHQGDRLLWQGEAPLQGTRLELPLAKLDFSIEQTATLTFHSTTPAQPEAPNPDARHLCFALYDLAIETR